MGTRPRTGTPLVERPDYALERSSHKQFGDACEMYICARLTWAGNPTLKVPDNWPDYDLIAKRPTGELQTISVRGNRAGNGKRAAWVRFRPEGWDWLACVRIDVVTEQPESAPIAWRYGRPCRSRPTRPSRRVAYWAKRHKTRPDIEPYQFA